MDQIKMSKEELQKTLLAASGEGNLELIKHLVEKGVRLGYKESVGGLTCCHLAAHEGHLELMEYFRSMNGPLQERDHSGNTCLYYAVKNGKLDVVKFLLESGNSIHEKDIKGTTLLMNVGPWVDVADYLIQKGVLLHHVIKKSGKSALLFSVIGGHLEVVKLLVHRGCSIQDKDINNTTTLHYAAALGHVDIVKYLLSQGFNPTVRNSSSNTPLHFASDCGNVEIIKLLIDNGSSVDEIGLHGLNSLFCAIQKGHVDAARYLINQGISLSQVGDNGYTALTFATMENNIELVKLLVQKGCSPNDRDKEGLTCLHKASVKGFLEIVTYFVEEGGSDFNQTLSRSYPRTMNLVTQNMFPVFSTNTNSLHLASLGGHLEVVKFLVSKGIKCDSGHYNPLHLACKEGNIDIVRYFLDVGLFGISEKSENDESPVFLAAQGGHLEIVKLLHDMGVSLYDKNTTMKINCFDYGYSSVDNLTFMIELVKDDNRSADHWEITKKLLRDIEDMDCLEVLLKYKWATMEDVAKYSEEEGLYNKLVARRKKAQQNRKKKEAKRRKKEATMASNSS